MKEQVDQKPDGKKQIALLGAAHSFNHSLFYIAPTLLPLIMKSLNVTKSEIGLVSMIASFTYGFGALVGGPLGDKIGEERTITISLLLSGLSTFIMLMTDFAQGIYVYALALILMALWASLYHPTANSLISKTFKGRVAEAMGLHGVGGTIGVAATPIIAGGLGECFGWTWAFTAFGLICIVLALALARSFGRKEARHDGQGTLINALKIRELWILLIFNVAVGLFMKGVELYTPIYLYENRNIDLWWVWIAYTAILTAGISGQWVGGKASDKYGSKKVLIATMVGVCLSLVSLLLFPIPLVGIILFVMLYGVSFFAHQPSLNSLTGFLSPTSQRGAVYGILFFTSFGIGSISQVIAGYMADAYGLDSAFYLFIGFAVAALLLSFRLPDKREE
ncbi:MFS transporter [Candidatus Bathyarchaeota archaeon]|nr:MFS transporter [Candidatus Bathyarchaeota archaeon]